MSHLNRCAFILAFAIMLVTYLAPPAAALSHDLLGALRERTVVTQCRGAGASAVDLWIARKPNGPYWVTIAPATCFRAARAHVQPQTTLGQVVVDLRNSPVRITLHTACMDINAPAANARHIMHPNPCRDLRMYKLCSTVNLRTDDPHAIQLAVWAIANNVSRRRLLSHGDSATLATAEAYLQRAGVNCQHLRISPRRPRSCLFTNDYLTRR